MCAIVVKNLDAHHAQRVTSAVPTMEINRERIKIMTREFLITKFVCSECGNNLRLTYETPEGAGVYADGEPTGAAMVQQVVAIEPCEVATRPLEEMRRAAKVLLGV